MHRLVMWGETIFLENFIFFLMASLVTVSAHWSLFKFSELRHEMMMNDDDIT